MKKILLERLDGDGCGPATEGTLYAGNLVFPSLERPWRPWQPGGQPFTSCVPGGLYRLLPHVRPNGDKALALENAGLGVYYRKDDRPGGIGRFLILIHKANWVHEIAGCIAIGLARGAHPEFGPAVMNSATATEQLLHWVGDDECELEILSQNSYLATS